MRYTKLYMDDISKAAAAVPDISRLFGKSILITGASGMICSAAADILFWLNKNRNAGITVYLAGRSRERIAERFAELEEGRDYIFVEYDATKYCDMDVCPDLLIHGASNANPAVYAAQPVETMLANIIGLDVMLRLAAKKPGSRLLYISSSEVYGSKDSSEAFKENDYGFVDILKQRASYPTSKRAAETLCVAYADEYGADAVIARPGHIYGPTITDSDSRASAQFTRKAVNGEDIVLKSRGMQLRSYCYTADCASALLTILLDGEKCTAYNISNRDSVCTISDIAAEFAKAANKKTVYEQAAAEEAKGYTMMLNSSLDARRLEALGWKAMFDLETGVRHTVDILKG